MMTSWDGDWGGNRQTLKTLSVSVSYHSYPMFHQYRCLSERMLWFHHANQVFSVCPPNWTISKEQNSRGHSRNQPKGGRNSLQCYISTRFAYHSSQFYSQRVQKPLHWALSAVVCTKLRLIHHAILVWTHKTTNLLSKIYFTAVQRVVSRPPRPIARMAPDR